MDLKGEDYGTKQGVGKLFSSKSRQIRCDKKVSVKNKKIKREQKNGTTKIKYWKLIFLIIGIQQNLHISLLINGITDFVIIVWC